ncbi:MAG: lysophospholipid acyltransferase family protein [Thermoanaerobaculia bacterium]|jgi:1-acyl-sn-glycerol-3-phosphate acyltransferase
MGGRLLAGLIAGFARLLAGATVRYAGYKPAAGQRIYFANHSSHLDFVVLWSALPSTERSKTRPVAGSDYWDNSAIKRYLAREVFRAVLVDRTGKTKDRNPVEDMVAALDAGDSLIIFPEGTRGDGTAIAPFKSGVFHVATRKPDVDLVPVMIENLNRILPKGEVVPVPLLSSITLGPPLRLGAGETKEDFLARIRGELERLG